MPQLSVHLTLMHGSAFEAEAEAEADAHDCDYWDFILQWVAETMEELELMREERMKEIYDFIDN